MKKPSILFVFIVIAALLTVWNIRSGFATAEPEATYTLGEGIDFATRNLSDPWDMSNFSDISQWLNHASPNDLTDIQVTGGLFSARTLGNSSYFFPLFPGYQPGVNSGKIGALFPINSSTYGCFYMALKANWSTPENNFISVFWAADKNFVSPGYQEWGQAYGYPIFMDKKNQWLMYRINLSSPNNLNNKPWTYQQYWQAFRITPSLVAGTQFSIDWVRLTNCQPVYANITGLPQGTYRLFIGTGSPERQIIMIDSFSPAANGAYNWDVQGLPAGSYTYYVKTLVGNPVQQGQVNIVGSPIVTFTSPSPYSGQDYANGQGNPWDMEPLDITLINCATYGFSNGILSLDTQSRACAGPGANEADPKIYLNSTDHGDLSSYRYLSFSSSTTGYPWSVPDLGMIVRLIWRLDRPGEDCYYISRAVALDVGWQTYTVDLYDPLNGIPEEFTPGNCPLISWRDQALVGPVVGFRVDPNENITGSVMHQEFDWIRLTKVEQVTQGKPVKIRVLLNKPSSGVTIGFYYTTDLSQPKQHPANEIARTTISAPYLLYLPIVSKSDPNYDPFVEQIPADVTYIWNTSGVTPGEYYICAEADDGYNQATYCSQAPVKINP